MVSSKHEVWNRSVSHLEAGVLLCLLLLVGCATTRFQPESLDYRARAETQSDRGVRVSAVLSDRVKRTFARRWYDNNFFDDGDHFRFVHRTTGRVVDLSDRGNFNAPRRAIPKASRQIRGIANLLLSFDYHPVIYPSRVDRDLYDPDVVDPATGEVVKNPYYLEALNLAKLEARFKGYFIEDIWRDLDMFEEKIPLMLLMAMRNSASFMHFWYDTEKEKIKGQTYDSFDIDVLGNYHDIEIPPFIGKCIPRLTADIQSDERFVEEPHESYLR